LNERITARDLRGWRQRSRVVTILSRRGKPHLVRRIARLRCDARFRFSAGSARNRACNPSHSTRFRRSVIRVPQLGRSRQSLATRVAENAGAGHRDV